MVNYEKAAYSSCRELRYYLEGPCSHYFVLQLGAGVRDVLLGIEANISVETNYEAKN